MTRYLAVAGAALLVLVLLIVGGFALKSALTTKSQTHTSPSPTRPSANRSAGGPSSSPAALQIKVTGSECKVFVQNQPDNTVLQGDSAPVSAGTDLQYGKAQLPVNVEISDPGCASVYVHGKPQAKSAARPWSFSVRG
jgi:hypothetical protein